MRTTSGTLALTISLLALAACGGTTPDSPSASAPSTAAPSQSASPTVAADVDAAVRAGIGAAPASAGTPAGPVEIIDPATFRSQSQETAAGLVGAARRSVIFPPGSIDGVQLVMRFSDAGSARADAQRAAAGQLDQGTKLAFSDPAIPGSAGYDHVVNGVVVSRDLFFSVGMDEIRLGCASDGHGHPTRRALLQAARAWFQAAQRVA